MKFLRRFARALFKKNTYEAVNKYFTKANEVFFTFISKSSIIIFILVRNQTSYSYPDKRRISYERKNYEL